MYDSHWHLIGSSTSCLNDVIIEAGKTHFLDSPVQTMLHFLERCQHEYAYKKTCVSWFIANKNAYEL